MSIVSVVPYCPEWPNEYRAIRDELAEVFAPNVVAIEHIGSTSVPGLAAKPVIDVLLGAPSLADIEVKITALGERGFVYVPKHEREIPLRRYFVKSPAASLRVHLHGVEAGKRLWTEHMTFRDALRNDAALRSQYQALKLRLAEEFLNDKAGYTEAKAPFIQSVIAKASDRADLA